ncbi:MAG: hypothetical protein Q7R87_01220 [Nanoarchaeota archaeon]|nr:hypothetical protein [Nanoarchaeota archaeon]
MILFQDATDAKNRYVGDKHPLREEANQGLCYFNRGSFECDYLCNVSREFFGLSRYREGDKLSEEKAKRLETELNTFSWGGINRAFGTDYLVDFVKQGIKIGERNLGKLNLEQLFVPSRQDNPHGRVNGFIHLDTTYGFALNYKHFPIAVLGLSVNDGRVVINQLQGIHSFDAGPKISRKFKWTHALVNYTLDWCESLDVKEVVLKGVRNNYWVHHNFDQLVGLGLPVKDFEVAMKMDLKELRSLAIKTLRENKDKLTATPVLFLPPQGYMLYDITAQRLRWKGKRFAEGEDGNYYMSIN